MRSGVGRSLATLALTGLGAGTAGAADQAGVTPAAPVCRPAGKVSSAYKGPRCRPGAGLRLMLDGGQRVPVWSGSLASARQRGWSQRQALPGALDVVRGPLAGRRHVTRFSVRPGDMPVPGGGERAEVSTSPQATGGTEGTEAWYAWSTYFPANFNPVAATTFNVFTQFRQLHKTKDACPPNVAFQVNTRPQPARIRLAVRGGSLNRTTCSAPTIWSADLVPLRSRRWYDFVFHVRWSADPATGFVELFEGPRVLVPHTSMATLYRGQQVYAKQGLYRAAAAQTSHVLHTGMARF